MRLLKIMGLHLGPYKGVFVNNELKETSVNAYIYYTKKVNDKEEACNDKGELIGTFMGNEQRFALEAMVRNKIKPVIDQGLLDTPYYVSDIDYTNMAPHPHLVIVRRDNMPLAADEVDIIQQRVEQVVSLANLSIIAKSAISHNNLFKQEMHEALTGEKPKKAAKRNAVTVAEPEAQQAPQHHYNLRKRC